MSDGYWYLAGPMRGYPEFNFPAFREHARILRLSGYEIVSPAEKDESEGFDWSGSKGTAEELVAANFNLSETLKADIGIIADDRCLGVIAMDGWEKSGGAKAEVAFAFATGRQVLSAFYNPPVKDPHRNEVYLAEVWLYPLINFTADAEVDWSGNSEVVILEDTRG